MITAARAYKTEYGVERINSDYYFTAALDAKESVYLSIYTIKGVEIDKINISEYRLSGNVYSIRVSGLNESAFQYEYICDGEIVKDPYMKAHSYKRKYSEILADTVVDRPVYSEDSFDWGDSEFPNVNMSEAFMYQLHVRVFTKHSSSKVKGKGCFKGITEKIPYLKSIYVNQIELMPSYEFEENETVSKKTGMVPDYTTTYVPGIDFTKVDHEAENKLNYWGYKEGYYFCPKYSYAYSDDPVTEFKEMVKALHEAGIEVIMQMFFKKNTPHRLVIDCLRYWRMQYRIDGFHVMGENIRIEDIATDEFLTDVKLYFNNIDRNSFICTNFSNDNIINVSNTFMFAARKYLKSDGDSLSDFVNVNRAFPSKPYSVNYITCYEGLTLNDLVTYEHKHNEDNGENNCDGSDSNFSWNCGLEGKSNKKSVKELRIRQVKNALCLLLLSQGIPMIFMGDEFLNSQNGNNNPYCQDNEISWLNWKVGKSGEEILEYTRRLLEFRFSHKVLRQGAELKNMDYLSCGFPDISYHQDSAWKSSLNNYLLHIGVMLCGDYGVNSNEAKDDTIYIAYNMHWENHMFGLPKLKSGYKWEYIFGTCDADFTKDVVESLIESQEEICVNKRSVMVFYAVGKTDKEEK